MGAVKKLSNIQLELLKIFSVDLSDQQMKEIKNLLTNHFANKVSSEMDLLFKNKNWDENKIEEWAQEHMRTNYRNS